MSSGHAEQHAFIQAGRLAGCAEPQLRLIPSYGLFPSQAKGGSYSPDSAWRRRPDPFVGFVGDIRLFPDAILIRAAGRCSLALSEGGCGPCSHSSYCLLEWAGHGVAGLSWVKATF